MAVSSARVLLLLAACCASAQAGTDPRLKALEKQLRALDDQGYEGGLTTQDVALAQALADQAFVTGVPRKSCPPIDDLGGTRLGGDRSNRGGRKLANPVLDLLEGVIRKGARKQRDVALVAVARIGPGADFDWRFLEGRGAWAPVALAAITCDRWYRAELDQLWSPARNGAVLGVPQPARSELKIDLMIAQMLDRDRSWPEGIFGSGLRASDLMDEALTVERVRRLQPLLEGEGYALDLRMQALAFVQRLNKQGAVFEATLVRLVRSRTEGLWEEAAWVLAGMGGPAGADALADLIESRPYHPWPRQWGQGSECKDRRLTPRLASVLQKRLDDPTPDVRIAAINALGCYRDRSAIPGLVRALSHPFWSEQRAALAVLGHLGPLPASAITALERAARSHWSSVVRQMAEQALAHARSESTGVAHHRHDEGGFHRRANHHGLPICHGEEPGDGPYQLPGMAPFPVRWTPAKVHDLPPGFPYKLHEMRERKGYGTNTFLRTDGGWLFSTDLWHYDGELGYVSDAGQVQHFAPRAAHAAFILQTQFGVTVLGESVFDGGAGGELAVLERGPGGAWSYRAVLELPSEAFGYAFAPDGTLLVKDPYGAVAITRDRKILPLDCQ